MRLFVLDLLCCPECKHFPLELSVPQDPAQSAHPSRDVEIGYLECKGCARFYFIEDGIPRLLGDGFASLIDVTFPDRHATLVGDDGPRMQTYLATLDSVGGPGATESWNLDDVDFWEDKVYSDAESIEKMFGQISRSRADAGGRTLPRERALFRHIRPHVRGGGVLLDIGCGISQTVRTLCNPESEKFRYIGLELSISALHVNRRTLDGDFLLASADKLPFRPNSLDAAVMLGTLHHLALHGPSLERVVETVRPGGLIGLDEVIARQGWTDRLRPWCRSGHAPAESLHNEFVDVTTVRRALAGDAEVLEWHRLFSPVRGLLDRLLSNKMRTRPWLSRLVLAFDSAVRATIGRVWEVFQGSEILVLARRNEPRETPSP